MKSKMKRRMLAIVLCMVIALSNSSFIFASSGTEEPAAVAQEGDPQNVQETQTEAAVQDTPAVLSETTPEATPEATPEPTQVPEVTAAPTEAPQATVEPTQVPEVTAAPEATPAPTETPAVTAEPTQAPEVTAAPEATPAPTETPAVTAEPTQAPEVTAAPETTPEATPVPTEAPVTYNEAVELKHEFKDENGNVTATVTAQIPAGAFQADASELTMEVTVPDQATTEHVKKLMEESLPEHYMLGDTVLYDIRFKVNGTETESQQPIVITFENQNGITVKDVKKAVVFQLDPADPAVEGDKDELVTITQRNDMIESLQNSGQSTDNVDDYDLSEITLKEDGTSNKIQMEGRTSTIYGCYAYYEPVQVLTYEDDQVTVTVSAAENGVIPANAELKVVPITEDKETEDQYKDVEKKLQEKAEEEEYEIAGFLAYDITFVDPDGNETEPNGEVKVSIDYKEATIPESVSEEDVQNAEVTVMHLEEDEKGEVKEVVDMAQNEQVDVLATTEENKVEKAEVRTESFSAFVISWNRGDNLSIQIIDADAKEIGEGARTTIYEATSVTDLAKKYVIADYYFMKAIVGKDIRNSDDVKNATKIIKISYFSSAWQYCTLNGNQEVWKKLENNKIYFVYVKTIETEDTAGFIDINLYDYSFNENIGKTPKSEGLIFNGNKKESYTQKYNYWIGNWGDKYNETGKDHYAVQGIVDSQLYDADGNKVNDYVNYSGQLYPKLNVGSKRVLTDLFDKHLVGSGLNHLFVKNDDGYYVYNSAENYAYYDQTDEKNKDFTVYDHPADKGSDKNGDFMPLEDISESAEWYYGMTVGFNFIQPRNGEVDGKAMTFEFSGDDDVWVFIDGKLVLDIGGIHGATSGTINFATGDVIINNDGVVSEAESGIDNTLGSVTTLKGIFDLDDKTFGDYTEHRLEFIYLERGAGESNCNLKFNMPTIPKEGITVQKEIENYDDGAYTDVEFQFELYLENEDNQYEKVTDAEYTVKSLGSSEEGIKKNLSDTDGVFTLKHNEIATFEGLADVNTHYKVKEVGLSYREYDQIEVVSGSVTDEDADKDYTDKKPTENGIVESKPLTIGKDSYVLFRNRCAATNMKQLSITKKVEGGTVTDEFTVEVKIAGKPYVGDYWIGTDGYGSSDIEENGYTSNGEITFSAGQTITILGNVRTEDDQTEDQQVIIGFPSGTSFEVTEKDPGTNYSGITYTIKGGGENSSTEGKASGKFELEKNAEITITNHLVQPEQPDNPEAENVPLNKKIDWLGGGTDNPDTKLDDSESINKDYYYRLYLDVEGIPDKIPEGANIVFILDMSSSMAFTMDENQNSSEPEECRLYYVKSAAKQAIETIKTNCENQGVNNINIGLVTFNYGNAKHNGTYENGTKILSGFTNNYDELINKINSLSEEDLKNRTNYEAAFSAADSLLKSSQQENKYVVFITDGEANGYTDGDGCTGFGGNDVRAEGTETYTDPAKDNSESLNQAQQIAENWTDLSGFYTIAVSNNVKADTLKTLGPRTVPRLDIQANDKDAIEKAFSTVVSAITQQICDVTITDTLSQYVEFVNEKGEALTSDTMITGDDIALKVTKTVENEKVELAPDDYTVVIETVDVGEGEYRQRVKVNFGKEYFLEPGAVYTVSFNVKLTDQAFTDEMEDEGDNNTDYEINEEFQTSSGKVGHFSNTSATLTYSTVTKGELKSYTKNYQQPVVQIQERQDWAIYKKSSSDNGQYLEDAVFELKSENGSVLYTGTSKNADGENGLGYVEWVDSNNAPVDEIQIPVGVYILTEKKAPNGFALSAVSWQVTVKNMEAPEIRPILEDQTVGEALEATFKVQSNGSIFYQIDITNTPVFNLPSSGGSGIFWYLISGTAFMMAASLILYRMKRKEVLGK